MCQNGTDICSSCDDPVICKDWKDPFLRNSAECNAAQTKQQCENIRKGKGSYQKPGGMCKWIPKKTKGKCECRNGTGICSDCNDPNICKDWRDPWLRNASECSTKQNEIDCINVRKGKGSFQKPEGMCKWSYL